MTATILEFRAFFQALPTEADEARIGLAFSLLRSSGVVMDMKYRRALRDESVTFYEKRVHWDGKPCITKFTLGLARLTSDWSKVTCRKCLKHRPVSSAEARRALVSDEPTKPKVIGNHQQWEEEEHREEKASDFWKNALKAEGKSIGDES